MRMSRPPVRIAMVGLIGTILAGLVIVPAMATTLAVTGGIVLPTGAAWPGPDAIVVVTLIDTTNTTDSGNVIGQERIDGIGDGHVVFSVPFEADTIVRSHAYALFATMVEGGSTWQNPVGIPVITGGPVEGVALPVAPVTPGTGTIDGGIVLPQGTTLGYSPGQPTTSYGAWFGAQWFFTLHADVRVDVMERSLVAGPTRIPVAAYMAQLHLSL